MKISYNWLQSYFADKLPEPPALGDLLTMHSFEVEEIISRENDAIFDIDVLPNRGHDCLCHYGVAKEVSAVTGMPLIRAPLKEVLPELPRSQELSVEIQENDLCQRYSALVMKGVKVGPSPRWLCERLQGIGQKSINNIVDATNYVMFNIGQPLHAFDLMRIEKRNGKAAITVRLAAEGETITTLDGTEHTLTERNLLIVDGNADTPLAIAGVKGGMAALIGETTTTVVLEAANFNRTSVRKTARALNLRTDASVRFEHEISSELTLYALRDVAALIKECAGGEVEGYADIYPEKEQSHAVSVSLGDVNNVLGASLTLNEATSALDKLGFSHKEEEETFTVNVPFERLDLRIKEDLVEEIGRVHGYRHVAPRVLPPASWPIAIDKTLYYADRVRRLLTEHGFSEVYTYVFVQEGEVEILNPLAADKKFLRVSLQPGLAAALELNRRNADLLGLEKVKIFEIGKVFSHTSEYTALALGVAGRGRGKEHPEEHKTDLLFEKQELSQELGVMVPGEIKDNMLEIDLDALVEKLPQPATYEPVSMSERIVKYQKISPYPFVLRDIAVWVPEAITDGDALAVIREAADALLVTSFLFDTYHHMFTKKFSYAFRLVFQSPERTLTDTEANVIMERISAALHSKGWQVR